MAWGGETLFQTRKYPVDVFHTQISPGLASYPEPEPNCEPPAQISVSPQKLEKKHPDAGGEVTTVTAGYRIQDRVTGRRETRKVECGCDERWGDARCDRYLFSSTTPTKSLKHVVRLYNRA